MAKRKLTKKTVLCGAILVLLFSLRGKEMMGMNQKKEIQEIRDLFPRGGKNDAFARYFTGQSYLNILTR